MLGNSRWSFDVDIVGRCNLSCPSCPVGNMSDIAPPGGYMKPELLDKIVSKAVSECHVTNFSLYNWTEPFIHPDLSKMVRIVKNHNIGCDLSTNLNIGKKIEETVSAEPNTIKISVSGFDQNSYGYTHRDGTIETVKSNMIRLSEAKRNTNSSTRIIVVFHRYLNNQDDELKMRAFAESLGFDFTTYWAYLMPLEKNFAFLGRDNATTDFTSEDKSIVDQLALPLAEAINVANKTSIRDCRLRARQLAINVHGDVMLCCSVFDQNRFKIAPFLTTPLKELQARRYASEMCSSCMSEGLHVLMTYDDDEFESLARENVQRHHPQLDLEAIYGTEPKKLYSRSSRLKKWFRRQTQRTVLS